MVGIVLAILNLLQRQNGIMRISLYVVICMMDILKYIETKRAISYKGEDGK